MEIENPNEESPLPSFECTRCGACCRNDQILITVTNKDILRIAQTLMLTPHETMRALDFYLLDEGKPIPAGLEIIPSIDTEKGPAYIALKKLENGDCIFLKDDECMIHLIRPIVCRSYPFVFNKTDEEISWGLSSKKEICPGLGVGPRVSEAELISLAKEILNDFDEYRKVANEWNTQTSQKTALGFISQVLSIVDS